MSELDSELLQPSLVSDHDASGFRRPWWPHSIVFITFFAGGIAGGALFAFNARELGIRRNVWSKFLVIAVAEVAMIGGFVLFAKRMDGSSAELAAAAMKAVVIFLSLWIARGQSVRYRVFTGHGGEARNPIPAGAATILTGWMITVGVWIAFVVAFHAP